MRVMPPNDATGTLYYLHADHLGSTSVTTCGSGACGTAGSVVARQWYYPYGAVRGSVGTLPTQRTFTGQYSHDAGLGSLMYFNARYMSPYLNRWLQPDTIVPEPSNPQALNRYAFNYNNPVKYTDPTGHWPDWNTVIQFGSGVLYQTATTLVEGNSLGLINPEAQQQFEALATAPMDSDAFVAGRVVGGIIGGAVGLAEAVAGGGMVVGGITGGAASCIPTLGGGCAVGLAVVGAGAAVTVAGVSTAGNGVVAAVDNLNVLFSKSRGGSSEQFTRLSKGEIRMLQEAGYDIHDLKGGKNASKYDLFKDQDGNIYVKPKSGEGPGEPLLINLNDLTGDH
jgi:RHS repeat-associated protein